MMFQQKNCTTSFRKKTRVFAVIALILIAGALMVIDGEALKREKPDNWDVSFPMVNAHISFDQTFYGGGK